MSNVRTIYLDWNGGVIRSEGGPQLARQYDHLSNLVVFRNAPPLENYYLIVKMMAAEDDVAPHEMEPIRLAGPYWLIPNVYTQLVQPVIFQVCCKTETGDFEHHSAKYTLNVIESLGHDGSELEVDPSIMFDPYKEYVDNRVEELIVAAGDIIIDPTLTISGAAADAKATGDAISEANERLAPLEPENIPTTGSGYYSLSNGVVNPTPTAASGYKCMSMECSEGDVFMFSGSSYGNAARMYAFTDASYNVLFSEGANATLNNIERVAPKGSAYLFVNNYHDTVTVKKGRGVAKDAVVLFGYEKANDLLSNRLNNFINYQYDAPHERSANTTATDSTRCGIKRYKNYVVLDYDGGSTSAFVVKLNGNVQSVMANSARGWNAPGVSLESGEKYCVKLIALDGDRNGVTISVYRIGQSNTVGTATSIGTDEYDRIFTAEEGISYNIVLYVSSNIVLDKKEFLVTLEKVSESTEDSYYTEQEVDERVDYLNDKVNSLHDLVDYGYGNKKTVLTPSGSVDSGTYIGVERYQTRVKLNLQLAGYAKRVFLTGDIARTSGSNTYKNIDGRLQLQEGHKYRFSLKWLSGTATKNDADYLPEIYVYTSYARDYFDTVEYESSTERRKVFTAPSDLLNIVIYVAANVVLEDALYDVTLEEVFDAGIDIESYYIEEMTDTVNKVRDLNDSPALVFPVVTDIHRYKASVQTFEKMVNNIAYLAKSVKCDFVVNLGDTIEGNAKQDTSLGYAYDCIKSFASIGLPFFYTEGNHDNNPYTSSGALAFNIRQVFKAFYSATKGVTYNVAENGTDYFIDFENLGVRLVSINACNVNQSTTYAYGATTATWLTNVALNTQNTVILIDHLSPISSQVWNNNSPTHKADIAAALQAFVNGGGRLIQFSGHSHVDAAFVTPWVSIMLVCQKFEKADITTENYQRITGYIDVLGNPDRTAGTYSEDAWSVCIYKPFEAVLHMIRFGAGVDRHFHIDPISPQTLTSMLDDVTWSSSDTSVATVSDGVVTGVGTGKCAILAKDADGNYEAWIIEVE